MIRINLLPVRASKKRELGRQQLILLAVILIAAVVGNYFWYQQRDNELQKAQQRIASTQAQITLLEKTIGEVKSITQEKKALEDKLKILDKLKRGRTGPVKMMDELAMLIPTKVWLKDFTEQNGGVAFVGAAASYDDMAIFIKRLKASKHFKDVSLKHSQQTNETTVEFNILCTADYTA